MIACWYNAFIPAEIIPILRRMSFGRLPMDRLDELRLFLAIVDTGSFAAGGRQFDDQPFLIVEE